MCSIHQVHIQTLAWSHAHTYIPYTYLSFLLNAHPGSCRGVENIVHHLDLSVVVASTQSPQLWHGGTQYSELSLISHFDMPLKQPS